MTSKWMFYFFVSLILISLSASSGAAANECKDPFTFSHTHYYLVEELSCDPSLDHYSLHVSPNATKPDAQAGFVAPGCAGEKRFLDLYQGRTSQGGELQDSIVSLSDLRDQNQWGKVCVNQFCTGNKLFCIETTPDTIVDPSGAPIAVNFRVFSNDDAGSLIGYVKTNDDLDQSVKLHNFSGLVASAEKTFVDKKPGSCGEGIWEVQNSSWLSPEVMAFIIALKDNANYKCPIAPPSPSDGLSVGWQIGIAAGVSATVALGVGLGCLWHLKRSTRVYKALEGSDPRNAAL